MKKRIEKVNNERNFDFDVLKETQKKELKNNIGFNEDKILRKSAKKITKALQSIESEKIKKGYRYMVNAKTAILTHPNKFEERITNGFKFSK